MTWTELSQRPEELRSRVISVFSQKQLSPQYYFEEKLGLLSDIELEQHLQNLFHESASNKTSADMISITSEIADIGTSSIAQEPNEDSTGVQSMLTSSSDHISLEDVRQVRSIGWIRKNGKTTEDREYADLLYQELLLDLWYRRVAETGETYYPPLQNELLDEYTLISNE